jgi:hypothetical protein
MKNSYGTTASMVKEVRGNLAKTSWVRACIHQNTTEDSILVKSSEETKIIIQQCKMIIIEKFWNELINRTRPNGEHLLFYDHEGDTQDLSLKNFSSLTEAKKLLSTKPLRHHTFKENGDNEIDQILHIANLYWLDLIKINITRFEASSLKKPASSEVDFDLALLFELYNVLENRYPVANEIESWTGNLDQTISPLFKVYLRSINYDLKISSEKAVKTFCDNLFNSLGKLAISNKNNLPFTDEDFADYNDREAIVMKKSSLEKINSVSGYENRSDVIVGCPAFFSNIDNYYKHRNMAKDLFCWQMDLYTRILMELR